ncbi:hypothetical protein [Planococcus sp. CAU13]|uniref:hypothetical protein n=1 Tax=Planococcus sp. CAU13 TaxID=1541197 RepID=UPI00053009D4|nr:hypothetical protein [Planococcus sp. CAU13]
MAKSRPRTQEEFIIAGNSSRVRFVFDVILTLTFWVYTFLVIYYFAASLLGIDNGLSRLLHATFNTTSRDAKLLLLIGIILFFIFYFTLRINRVYNQKRFGNKKRRIYPASVTLEELSELGLMDLEEIRKLQQRDYIVFEKNPIISLKREKEM